MIFDFKGRRGVLHEPSASVLILIVILQKGIGVTVG
jgi:hypothetical protein